MGIDRYSLYYLGFVFILVYFYLFIPESDQVFDLYFCDIVRRDGTNYRMLVSKQTYVDYLAWRIVIVIMHFIILSYARKSRRYVKQIKLFTILWLGFIADYIIIYNQPVFYHDLGCILLPVSYSLFMGLMMFFTIILTITNKWKL